MSRYRFVFAMKARVPGPGGLGGGRRLDLTLLDLPGRAGCSWPTCSTSARAAWSALPGTSACLTAV